MRLLTRFTIVFLILLILIPLETYAVENKTYTTVTNQNTEEQKIVGSIPEANATLYASEKESNLERILTNFKLQVMGYTYSFPRWINVFNPTYYPNLYYSDINHDGKKDLIIVLTTGTGSGILIQEAHVFHIENKGQKFEEILVDNPIAIINKNIRTKLTKSEALISIGDKTTKINIKDLGIEPSHIFENMAFGSIVKFEVINNKLVAKVGAKISPSGGYLGDILITYTFKDNMYQAEEISFTSK